MASETKALFSPFPRFGTACGRNKEGRRVASAGTRGLLLGPPSCTHPIEARMHPSSEEPEMGKCQTSCHSHVTARGLWAARVFLVLPELLAFRVTEELGLNHDQGSPYRYYSTTGSRLWTLQCAFTD